MASLSRFLQPKSRVKRQITAAKRGHTYISFRPPLLHLIQKAAAYELLTVSRFIRRVTITHLYNHPPTDIPLYILNQLEAESIEIKDRETQRLIKAIKRFALTHRPNPLLSLTPEDTDLPLTTPEEDEDLQKFYMDALISVGKEEEESNEK